MKIDTEFLEKNILFHAIKSPYYMGSIIEHVDTDFFSNTDVKSVFTNILKFYKEYSKYPNITQLKTILTDTSSRKSLARVVSAFKGMDTEVDVDILVKQTEVFFREQAIIRTMLKASEIYKESNTFDASEIAEMFRNACGLTIVTDIGHDYFKDIEKHIEWLQLDHERISTGIDFLDKKLKGGFNKNGRAFYVFMGGTNAGKSIVLGNLAANCVRQNLCVPIISLEMDEQLYAQRLSANLSDLPIDELKNDIEDFRARVAQVQKDNPDAKLLLKEFPPGQLTVAGLDAYLTKIRKKGYAFDIVYLDYITLMRVEENNGMYENGKRLAEDLRALTYKHSVSFVTVLQANRAGVAGEMPKLDNTSESMGIAHTADFIGVIWRTDEDVETNTLRMGIVKNRIGENFGTIMLEMNPRTLQLTEVDIIYEDDKAEMDDGIKAQIEIMKLLDTVVDD
jgi:replicative DNA helicase